MDIGRIGLWTFQLDGYESTADIAAEVDELGYAALWIPEAMGRDALVAATLLLGQTRRITVATGIVPLYSRPAMTLNAAHITIETAFPGRFILGIGVSHAPAVQGMWGMTYGPPLATMREYLVAMDNAFYMGARPATAPRRVLAALGPKMLALAAEHADGAHPYLVTPDHTEQARKILGADKLLAVEQKVVLTTDAEAARNTARHALRIYTTLPNYVNSWKRIGLTDDDITQMSDSFVDTLVAWGTEDNVRARVQEHLDAGADHVCMQVLPVQPGVPIAEWRRLAPALLS